MVRFCGSISTTLAPPANRVIGRMASTPHEQIGDRIDGGRAGASRCHDIAPQRLVADMADEA